MKRCLLHCVCFTDLAMLLLLLSWQSIRGAPIIGW